MRRIRRKGLVGGGLLLVVGLVLGVTIALGNIQCNGGPCYGDSGNNDFIGTNQHDHIYGYGGDDEWDAKGGDDTIEGGAGHDVGHAGDDQDTVDGGDGDDDEGTTQAPYLAGGNGSDSLYGGEGMDAIRGGDANDDFHGNNGIDTEYGKWGSDPEGANDDMFCGDPGTDHYSANPTDNVNSDCEIPLN
jgi:Ca2+-binding RTX toxin-like protein